jgi:hypothetical protein
MLPGTYDDDDSTGVRRDILVDARVKLQSDLYDLREMNVNLDGMADDVDGIWTKDDRATMRSHQKEVQELIAVGEDNLADIEEELARVKQETPADEKRD